MLVISIPCAFLVVLVEDVRMFCSCSSFGDSGVSSIRGDSLFYTHTHTHREPGKLQNYDFWMQVRMSGCIEFRLACPKGHTASIALEE
jgi:hypothetical protein